MDKSIAQTSVKKISRESALLEADTLIQLFEIDVSELLLDRNVAFPVGASSVFRFHNNNKLSNNIIFYRSNSYYPAPINAEGFEISSKGTLPTPTLSITTNTDGIQGLSLLKSKLYEMGDLTGAKVTRIRTFLKFLHEDNFASGVSPEKDENAEFTRDIFYIDRKSKEDKFSLVFELASLMDVQGILLPGRTVVSTRCTHQYRGPGCFYENNHSGDSHHAPEIYDDIFYGVDSPRTDAIPIATENDEEIKDLLGTPTLINRSIWKDTEVYSKGEYVYLIKGPYRYYYVAKRDVPAGIAPPHVSYWLSDQCSKSVHGCKLRWATRKHFFSSNPNGNSGGGLPFGGYPATNKLT